MKKNKDKGGRGRPLDIFFVLFCFFLNCFSYSFFFFFFFFFFLRREFAANLARLAEVARSFLEKSQFFKQSELLDNRDVTEIHQQESYDSEVIIYYLIYKLF